MKKYTGFVAAAGLVLSFSLISSFASVAAAKEGSDDIKANATLGASVDTRTSVDIRQEDRGERQEDRQEDRGQRQEDRQAFRAKLQDDRQAFVAKLKTDRTAFLAEVQAKKAEWQNAKADVKQKFFETVRGTVATRFDAVITALADFQVKAGDIIVTLHADGNDTTEAQSDLDLSKQKLSDAKAKYAEVKAMVPANYADITADAWARIKVGARETRDLLKESREYLHQALQEIRSLNGEADASASANIN